MGNRRGILLLSGGLDSGSLLYWCINQRWEIYPIFVNYGQSTLEGELFSTKLLLKKVGLKLTQKINIKNIGQIAIKKSDSKIHGNEYFPSRNLLLLLVASIFSYQLDINDIFIGLISGSTAALPDCSEKYIFQLQNLLNFEYDNLRINAPFINREKTDIVNEAMGYGLTPETTYSCNQNEKIHCWACSSCLDRLDVFVKLGIF